MNAEQTDPSPLQSPLGRADRWRDTAVYGLAHFGKSLFWYGGEILFAYFLTEIAGFPPAAMAVVLVTGFVLNAGLDLAVGVRFHGHMADPRAAGRLQLVGAALSGAAVLAFFATPFLPPPFRLVHALAAGVAFRLAYAVYDVPQNALIALAGAHSQARTRLAAARIACSGLATLAIAAAVAPLLAARADGQDALLLLRLTAGAAVIAVGGAWLLSHTLSAAPNSAAPEVERARTGGFTGLWPLLAIMAAMSLAPPLFQKLEPYFAAYVLRSPGWGGAIILAVAAGQLVGQPLWFRLSQRWSRETVLTVAAVVQALGGALFLATPLATPPGFAVASLLVGIGNGGVGMSLWAAYGDAARRYAPGREGLAFALFSAVAKLALAAGAALVALLLARANRDTAARDWIEGAMACGLMLGSLATIALIRFTKSDAPPPPLPMVGARPREAVS